MANFGNFGNSDTFKNNSLFVIKKKPPMKKSPKKQKSPRSGRPSRVLVNIEKQRSGRSAKNRFVSRRFNGTGEDVYGSVIVRNVGSNVHYITPTVKAIVGQYLAFSSMTLVDSTKIATADDVKDIIFKMNRSTVKLNVFADVTISPEIPIKFVLMAALQIQNE